MPTYDEKIPSFVTDVVSIRKAGSGEAGTLERVTGMLTNIVDRYREYGNARPIKATISETARYFTHPIEDGSIITDHRIIMPVQITIAVILRPLYYRQIYNTLRNDFKNSQKFTIQTKTTTYENMFLSGIPHEEDTTRFDTVTMLLEFIEAKFIKANYADIEVSEVEDPKDSSTADRGEQTNQPASSFAITYLKRIFGE